MKRFEFAWSPLGWRVQPAPFTYEQLAALADYNAASAVRYSARLEAARRLFAQLNRENRLTPAEREAFERALGGTL